MLQPLQVPLIFWAFAMLGHSPAPAVLLALEARVRSLSSHLTAQVLFSHKFPSIAVSEAYGAPHRIAIGVVGRGSAALFLQHLRTLAPSSALMHTALHSQKRWRIYAEGTT